MTDDEKNKYALEELNRWARFVDNFVWVLSSVLLTGTVFIYNEVLLMLFGEHSTILKNVVAIILSIIIVLIWYWYSFFINESNFRAQIIFERINSIEKKIKKDILPDFINNPDKNVRIESLKKNKKFDFRIFMRNIKCLVLFLSVSLIIIALYNIYCII